jgi:hypothetical protein
LIDRTRAPAASSCPPDPERRRVLGALGALPFVAATVPAGTSLAASATTGERPANDTPTANAPAARGGTVADTLVRMRCAPDGGWAIWAYSGALVVKPEGELARTVVRIEGFSFNRAIARGPGVYDYELDEVGWYCDPQTGRVLETWTNPFTGREVRPGHYRSPQKQRFEATRVVPVAQLPPGAEFRGEITSLADVAGLVAVTEDLYVKLPARPATATSPARAARVQTSLATHVARAEDLAKPASDWLDAQLSYTTMNAFAPWLGMDGTPGVQNMRLIGRKLPLADLERLPAWLLERVRREHPTFLDVPRG